MDTHDYPDEVWKVIPFASNYAVSDKGRIRKLKHDNGGPPRILKRESKDRYGYIKTCVQVQKGVSLRTTLHRLIARTFLGEPPSPAHQVAHFDGDKTNNNLENLRWATLRENVGDAVRHGSRKGEKNGAAVLTRDEAMAIRSARERGVPVRELIAEYRVSESQIRRIEHRQSWA